MLLCIHNLAKPIQLLTLLINIFLETLSGCIHLQVNLLVLGWLKLETKNPPPESQKYPKETPRLHELFQKVRANFCLLSCESGTQQNLFCSDELSLILAGFLRVNFLLREIVLVHPTQPAHLAMLEVVVVQ